MFKEFVSGAIIIDFVLNVLFVDHPDTASYTFYFSLSFLGLTPFMALWAYWMRDTSTTSNTGAARLPIVAAMMGPAMAEIDLEAGMSRESQNEPDSDKALLEAVEDKD